MHQLWLSRWAPIPGSPRYDNAVALIGAVPVERVEALRAERQEEEEPICCHCLDELSARPVVCLPCGHTFHSVCADTWKLHCRLLGMKFICPYDWRDGYTGQVVEEERRGGS
ncbi:hypothetical protein EJ03DRAFT_70646 [Teratosphaeria nubilosa]|uniref:RING-type domain-containing protein n=1 Tax=Teratosphaeria nubilosa TaxID=161662 RepID=A0A6G1LMS6_9PEZI|nr:hypothetical protein EJ03DRAFT_70646 [Teratosphaeria nubilosa]